MFGTGFGETAAGRIIRRMPNIVKFKEDPDTMLVMSLEDRAQAARRSSHVLPRSSLCLTLDFYTAAVPGKSNRKRIQLRGIPARCGGGECRPVDRENMKQPLCAQSQEKPAYQSRKAKTLKRGGA